MIRSKWLSTPKYQAILGRHIQEVLEKNAIESTYCECSILQGNIKEKHIRNKRTTLRLLGNHCTRDDCVLCPGNRMKQPPDADPSEHKKIAAVVEDLNLNEVTIASVHRDDLNDGGASNIAKTITEIKKRRPWALIEVLVHDFNGEEKALKKILDSGPDIITYQLGDLRKRLTEKRQPIEISLDSLEMIRRKNQDIPLRVQIFVGRGERWGEVLGAIRKLRKTGINKLCISQHLKDSKGKPPVSEYIDQSTFELYERAGYQMGFDRIWSVPWWKS